MNALFIAIVNCYLLKLKVFSMFIHNETIDVTKAIAKTIA